MKKILSCVMLFSFLACNVSVDKDEDRDTTKLDSIINKIDTTAEKGWDTVKENFKDLKGKVKERFDDDTTRR